VSSVIATIGRIDEEQPIDLVDRCDFWKFRSRLETPREEKRSRKARSRAETERASNGMTIGAQIAKARASPHHARRRGRQEAIIWAVMVFDNVSLYLAAPGFTGGSFGRLFESLAARATEDS